MGDNMSFLRLQNVGKSFESHKVLSDINLNFSLNEFVCIIGPSGSGKTTLLNIIGLLENQDDGKIYINEKVISDKKKQFYIKLK